jgi:transposase
MGAIKRMDQIIHIIEVYQRTRSIKATTRTTGCARNTIRGYLRLAAEYDKDLSVVMALPEDELRRIFYPGTPARDKNADRHTYFNAHYDDWVKELQKTGVTRYLLWEEYRESVPDGYSYTQFCVLFRERAQRKNLTLAINHKPGKLLQLDYTGATIPWVDRMTGEVHQCQVLVAISPFSQYTFAIALPSQKTADFVHGITRALGFFGGLPQGIISDNLKAFVIKPDRYEPTFNDVIIQLGDHYELDLQATRPYRPKDKAAVEGAVKTVYTRLFAPLRNTVFHSPEEINTALLPLLKAHNEMPFQVREGSRANIFFATEKPLLRPLPCAPFLVKNTVKAKVNLSYHVYLSACRNYYSVPFRFVGKTAEIVYTRDTVEIFVGANRVATHPRCHAAERNRYVTDLTHMPRGHQEWRKAEGLDAKYFLGNAAKIGPATEWAIGRILAGRYHESQAYRACQGVFGLGKRYGSDRLEAAAVRLQLAGKATYSMLRNVLEKNLDVAAETPDLFTPPIHENIRGPSAYT